MKLVSTITKVTLFALLFCSSLKSSASNSDSLCGLVFNDANGNGIYDLGESVIPNAEVLVDSMPCYTDLTGFYHVIVGEGSHTISLIIPNGWAQTYPANPSYYTINTSDSSDICGFDFGLNLQISQSANCYSFDDSTVPPDNQQQAFNIYGNGNPGFLQDWNVTSGTPSIETSGELPGVNAYDGNQYALIGVCGQPSDYAEGVSLSHNFVPGQSYQVSLAIRNAPIVGNGPTPIDVNFILLQSPIVYNYNPNTGCSPTPAVPAGSLIVDSITNFAQNSWSVISFTISNLSVPYTQLWIRLNFVDGSDQPTTAFCFDSVCVTPIPAPVTADCYSFDDSTVPPDNQQQAFNIYGNGHPGFLQDWNVTSGTPSIETSGELPGVNAYDGNQYALIGVCGQPSDYAEGVSLSHNFVPGQSYQVSMAIRNAPIVGNGPTPIDVNFILLQSPIVYNYNPNTGCSPTPAVPAGSLIVDSITNFAQNSWSVISFTISNLSVPYTQLWIRLNFVGGSDQPTTAFCFDSVCVQSIPTPVTADCYSFDDSTVPVDNQQQAFNIYGNGHPGFLQDWNVTSGTPSIQTDGELPGVNAYDGNQYALIGVCGQATDYSEGVSLYHNFVQGQSYTVSMAIRNAPIVGSSPSPIDVNFILLQSPIVYNYNPNTGCSPTPAVPAGSLIVDSITNFAQNSWSVISFNINNLNSNYSQLWFRVNFVSGPDQPTTAFCFDSVCISGTSSSGDTTTAIADIPATGDVPVLYQSSPNPFSATATIRYYLPESTGAGASINVYDITGKPIKQYPLKSTGNGSITLDAAALSSGVYLYSLSVDNVKINTKRMLVAK